MKAIIISSMPAAGKTELARIISTRLNVPMLGGTDVLKGMAIERGYKPGGEDWWDSEEGMRFLKERSTNPDFDKETDRRLKERIDQGNVVVTSYPAPWIMDDGFKVWLAASPEIRAERMATRDNKDIKEMKKVIAKRDRENKRLYKKIYNIEYGVDMRPFDIVVETDDKAAEQVADIVINEFKSVIE